MTVTIRVPTSDDIDQLSKRMRICDQNEVMASGGMMPADAVQKSVEWAAESWSCCVDDEMVMMWGYGPAPGQPKRGIIWMLATDDLNLYKVTFLRLNKPFLDAVFNIYDSLENYVDARNTSSIRWLRWLGFTIDPPAPFGVGRLMFHHFHKEERRWEHV